MMLDVFCRGYKMVAFGFCRRRLWGCELVAVGMLCGVGDMR